MGKVLQEIKTILRKNTKVFMRNKSDLRSEFLAPLIIMIVLGAQRIVGKSAFLVLAPILIPIGINSLYRKLIVTIVSEKSEKYRETQKIIGLSNSGYLWGWIVFFQLRSVIISVIFSIGLILCRDCFQNVEVYQLIIVYILSNFSCITFNFVLTSFFQVPQFACELCALLQIFFPFIPLFIQNNTNVFFLYLMSLLPQTGLALAFMSETNRDIRITLNFTPLQAIYVQIFSNLIYLLLFFYFDQVIPNEFGIRKHPLFFIKDLLKSKQRKTKEQLSQRLLNDDQNNNYDNILMQSDNEICSAKFYEKIPDNWKATIEIRNLNKQFGDFKAVNNISFNLYQSKILCLLGHNGAGKTTTISLLTGLISKSSGDVKIYGMDLNEQIDEIRKYTGLCSQKDILYDNLTVEEHLRFVGEIKQVEEKELDIEIEQILQKCNLVSERKKNAGILSGGFKRKLSLGMSLIGGSKIVYLDEPTSGLDPVSRQGIWDILEQIRNENRTIILTTHFLDEAERLADRISIMSRGQLLCMGTSAFIKKNFGQGYQLVLSPKPSPQDLTLYSKQIDQVTEHLKREFKQVKQIEQQYLNQHAFLMPFESQDQFPDLCIFLESLSMVQFGFTLNTLEDAFIKIGQEEDKYFQTNENLNNHNFMDINNMNLMPKCLEMETKQIFSYQFTAMFLRKVYITYRDWTLLLSYSFPMVLAILGVISCKVLEDQIIDQKAVELIQSIVFNNVLGFAYCLNTSIFISTTVMERENKLKYALNVMGCKIGAYWLATLCFDYLMYMITVIILVIVIESEKLLLITFNIDKFFLSMALYGLNITTLSYACGFLFSKKNSAVKLYPILLYIGFYSIPWACVNGFSKLSLTAAQFCEVFFVLLSPPFAWSRSLIVFYQDAKNLLKPKPLIYDYWCLISIMAVQAIFFFILTLYLDYRNQTVKKQDPKKVSNNSESSQFNQNLSDSILIQEQKDIEKEAIKVINNKENNKISMQEVYKTYDNGFQALKGISFCVEKNQIMGLLGPNGAGKSTSFNIVTSAENVTSGEVLLKEQRIVSQTQKVFKDVGICAQTDCIWDNLTPVEHLYLFGRLKGLWGSDLKEAVDYFINTMQLTNYINTKAKNLSGGNKRKLCVSNALIGAPDLLFFDEPSTGLDPIAKRFLWNSLKQNLDKKKSSILLTTHSMEEAEYLCYKIAILINGKFICFGTLQDLKNKYGRGFTLQVKTKTIQDTLQAIQSSFKTVKQLPGDKENYYQIQVQDHLFLYSKLFSLLQSLIQQQIIQDYSVSQSSLEQIFIYFSKFQQQKDD